MNVFSTYLHMMCLSFCITIGFMLDHEKPTAFFTPSGNVSRDVPNSSAGLFDSDEIIKIRIKGNIRELMNDRKDVPSDHPMVISYNDGTKDISIGVQMRSRGHFRKTMGDCTYPPLLVGFEPSEAWSGSIFREQRKTKLVVPCSNGQLVTREWLAYRIYNLITPLSFRVRMVELTFTDERSGKDYSTTYGFFLEEEGQMARRNAMVNPVQAANPKQCAVKPFLDMTVFEYMIGNTDWSVEYGQNVKFLAADSISTPVAVPYDFDQSGLVDAPYAKPAEELQLGSVVNRRYRGYCVHGSPLFDSTVALFKRVRPEVWKLVDNTVLFNDKEKKKTIKFLEGFYSVLADDAKWTKEFNYPCDPRLPGVNVVLKGLREE